MKESAGITNQLLWPERDRLCNYFPGTSIGSPDPILQACAKGAGADRVPSRRFDELCGQSFRLVSSGRNVGCSYPQRANPKDLPVQQPVKFELSSISRPPGRSVSQFQ